MTETQAENANKTAKTVKERSNMVRTRRAARLSQKELAKRIKVSCESIINWEKAHTTPQLYQIADLRDAIDFTGTDEELLQVFSVGEAVQAPDPQPCQEDANRDKLESSDSHLIGIPESEEKVSDMDPKRRKINTTIAIAASTIPTIPLVNTTQLVLNPLIDAYLNTCETSLGTWWYWYNTGNYTELEKALSKNVPMLKGIATTPFQQATISPYHRQAATIAVKALIMLKGIATSNMDYLQREKYCYDAVQMATLSGDKNLLALAQYWYGDTFVYCYRQPDIATQHLNDALSNVDGNALIATQIYSDLSIAHAQDHDESNALECIELAYTTIPSQPTLDNRLYVEGHAELDQKVGKTYLYLAEYLPDKYAEKARDTFEQSTSKQATSTGFLVQAFTRKADAYRLLGDKDECVTCLTNAYEKASSVLRLTQIDDVLGRVPDKWKSETPIVDLTREVSNALVVAR